MADENTTPPPTIEASDLPPKVGGDSSVTLAEAGTVIPEVAPDAPAKPAKYDEPHSEAHPHFRWHADALVDGHVYHGLLKDISMKGANLLLDHNVQNATVVKLHIHVPPLDVTSPHRVLEVSGKITSTIYDGNEDAFRSGVVFLQFTRESDRTYLQSRMLER